MAQHYQTAVLPARPRKPRDKAKVEAAVLLVERWVLARRARAVITISQFSKRAICETLKIAPGRVAVTLEGPRPNAAPAPPAEVAMVRGRYGLTRPYLAAFGGGALHKNIPRLVAAFATSGCAGPHVLALVGHLPPDVKLTTTDRQHIVATGYVPAKDLLPLLSGAEAFVLPSLYEGFGLPVLEAQQVGVPVVCSTAGSLPEVAGDGAVYFDPYSIADMAEKMAQVVGDPALRAELRQKGLRNVQRFSWEQTARETLAVYARIYKRRRQP
jgi:glycosyltransferase involved in cell wall biosynthesis